MEWLEHHKFFDITGIKRKNINYCEERSQKAIICERLQITHFIDGKTLILGS